MGKKPKAEVNVLPQFSPPSQHLCYLIRRAVRWTDEFSWLSLFYRLQGATSVSPDPFSPLNRKLNTNYSIKATWRINLITNKEVQAGVSSPLSFGRLTWLRLGWQEMSEALTEPVLGCTSALPKLFQCCQLLSIKLYLILLLGTEGCKSDSSLALKRQRCCCSFPDRSTARILTKTPQFRKE